MAIPLHLKPNVVPPGGDYPYGNIKDNPGDGTGTPVNSLVYADLHQFFARLIDQGGVTPNNLPENNANGFQYFVALQNVIQSFINALIDSAPGTLDTLNEIAAALGDDPNLATTLLNSIAAEALTRANADTALLSNIETRALKQQASFTNFALLNGAFYNSGVSLSYQPAYLKDTLGFVHLRGEISIAMAGVPVTVAQLPLNHRPSGGFLYYGCSFNDPSYFITIKDTGELIANGGTGNFQFDLEKIPSFYAEI